MTVYTCHWSGRKNTVSKHLTNIGSILSVSLKEDDFDIRNPIFLLNGAQYTSFLGDNWNYLVVNYGSYDDGTNLSLYSCFTDKRTYCYYITDVTIENNELYYVHCTIDLLMTYRAWIKNAITNGDCIITRSGSKTRSNEEPLVDNLVSLGGRDSTDFDKIEFNAPFTWDNPWYVLVVSGGEQGYENSTGTN